MLDQLGGTSGKLQEAENIVLKTLQENIEGLDGADLMQRCQDIPNELYIKALNSLIEKSRLNMFNRGDGGAYFKYVSEDQAAKYKYLTSEELRIIQFIEDAGSQGIQLKLLLASTGLQKKKIDDILKKLSKSGAIKSMKSASKGNSTVWLLADVEPGHEVTGGLAGTDHFDLTRIETVCERVEARARQQGRISHRELLIHIKQLGELNTDQLRDEDINQIIQSMVFDQRLEQVPDQGQQKVYKAANWGYAGLSTQIVYEESDV